MLEEIQEPAEVTTPDIIKKKWRAKVENKSLAESDLLSYFQLSAPYFLTVSRKDNASEIGESHEGANLRKCYFKFARKNFFFIINFIFEDETKRKFLVLLFSFTLHFVTFSFFHFDCAL
jgi:hypothetical protein